MSTNLYYVFPKIMKGINIAGLDVWDTLEDTGAFRLVRDGDERSRRESDGIETGLREWEGVCQSGSEKGRAFRLR